MESNTWSNKIQGPLTLDLTRELKFRDDRKSLLLYLLGLKPKMKIVDIGCGPGALTRKLAHWLGENTEITGIDRDNNFIEYARKKAKNKGFNNIEYIKGDALDIPLEENSVDACTSHTVIEHVPNKKFLKEQKRICKKGGKVSVMFSSPQHYIKTNPKEVPKMSDREKELWSKFDEVFEKANEKYIDDTLWVGFENLPKLFEELGFKNIIVDGIALPVALDDSRNNFERKIKILEAKKQQYFEKLNLGINLLSDTPDKQNIEELRK
ncbi:MAG: class I SAM-dependent methyltransferase [Nanoarchaeota archaeon]